ncbi:MAG: MBL fold metallo-hydrolase [Treponema sp.]|jgi:glyoxylase-like metal-dependent hydrolase (beta-lactamase superfamily II)|nr:MBL fold metallo-hydrolase [Treponema sp.]
MIDHVIVGEIATNCWIVPLDGESGGCALIDPGADPQTIIARLQRQGYRPVYILLTHAHFDHIAALPDLAASYGGVEIAIHREEAGRLGPESHEIHRRDFAAAGNVSYVDSLWKPMPPPTRLLAEGDRIGPFKVLHLPGHSPGSSGFLLEEEKLLFSGDTLFKAGIGRTDLPGGDWDTLRRTLERLFAMDGDIRVHPGHGPVTTIGGEKGYTW